MNLLSISLAYLRSRLLSTVLVATLLALGIATITVLKDMNRAARAGSSTIPLNASAPAAKGRATTLYPVAQKRF